MKKKKLFEELAQENMAFFEDGKIKAKKGKNIDLKKSIKNSVKSGMLIRGSKAVPNREKIETYSKYNAANEKVRRFHVLDHTYDDKTHATRMISGFADSWAKYEEGLEDILTIPIRTLVVTLNKKTYKDFNMAEEGVVGDLLRATTLAPIYKEYKNNWKKVVKATKSKDIPVWFIPDLLMFRDSSNKSWPVFKHPEHFNLVLFYIPDRDEMETRFPSDDAYAKFIAKRIHYTLIDLGCFNDVTIDLSGLMPKPGKALNPAMKHFFSSVVETGKFFYNCETIRYGVPKFGKELDHYLETIYNNMKDNASKSGERKNKQRPLKLEINMTDEKENEDAASTEEVSEEITNDSNETTVTATDIAKEVDTIIEYAKENPDAGITVTEF